MSAHVLPIFVPHEMHLNIKKYQCEICSNNYSRPSYLKQHLDKVHRGKECKLKHGQKSLIYLIIFNISNLFLNTETQTIKHSSSKQ